MANSYDARSRLTQSVLSNTATTSYSYDPANNLTQVTDPDSKVTQYAYDNANRRTGTTYAYGTTNATTWSMAYTPLGQLQALAKPTAPPSPIPTSRGSCSPRGSMAGPRPAPPIVSRIIRTTYCQEERAAYIICWSAEARLAGSAVGTTERIASFRKHRPSAA